MVTFLRHRARKKVAEAGVNTGQTAMIFGSYARADSLTEMLKDWHLFKGIMRGYGFPVALEADELFRKAMALIESSLPVHVCPRCRGEANKPSCSCEGRGYFDRTQENLYAVAALRGRRDGVGDERAVHVVVSDVIKGKLPRAMLECSAEDIADELMQEALADD